VHGCRAAVQAQLQDLPIFLGRLHRNVQTSFSGNHRLFFIISNYIFAAAGSASSPSALQTVSHRRNESGCDLLGHVAYRTSWDVRPCFLSAAWGWPVSIRCVRQSSLHNSHLNALRLAAGSLNIFFLCHLAGRCPSGSYIAEVFPNRVRDQRTKPGVFFLALGHETLSSSFIFPILAKIPRAAHTFAFLRGHDGYCNLL